MECEAEACVCLNWMFMTVISPIKLEYEVDGLGGLRRIE
jgi:hypothetical protein